MNKKAIKKTNKISPKKKSKIKSSSKIDIDQILLKNRQLFLFEDINEQSSKRLVKEMFSLSKLNSNPIVLWINSQGGSVYDGFAIIDTIMGISVPVITVINGEAASMAGLISIAGAERLMTKNSVWMAHDVSTINYDYATKFLARAENLKLLQKRVFTFLAEHTKLSSTDLEKARNQELWLFSKECKKKGIIDAIMGESREEKHDKKN